MLNLKILLPHTHTNSHKNVFSSLLLFFGYKRLILLLPFVLGRKPSETVTVFLFCFFFFLESNFSHAIGFQKISLDFCKTEMDWQVADYCFTL